MMCKYYWCAGYIKEPPHLPIDSINLKNAGIKGKCWTKDINDKNDYKEIIDWLSKVDTSKLKKIFLVHGEKDAQANLSKVLTENGYANEIVKEDTKYKLA